MIRTLLAACCLVGLVLGGTLAPAIGVGTPVPDLGASGVGNDDGGDGAYGDGDGGVGSGDVDGNGSNDLGVDSYGGIAAGGYPRRATVGGALSLSDHEAFRVESPRPRRWRLGAYASYTGDGWARNGTAPEPLTEPLSTTLSGRSRPRYEARVTARRPFDGLISPWRPAFATAGDRRVLVDDGRALTVDGRVEAGDRYTVLTYGRVPREAAAAGGDGDVPPAVERRYTQLPESTPARLGDRTAEITAGAETSYERAVAVERWLEANKAYSLDATHDRDGDVADEFVFEMAAGYCQYFATAMVAMLRTQDVPARYVTGYGPGEPVGDDEYVVRGRNAHAWVEVYFPEVGWTRFDPTPAGPRRETEQQRLSQARANEVEEVEPDRTPTPTAANPDETNNSGGETVSTPTVTVDVDVSDLDPETPTPEGDGTGGFELPDPPSREELLLGAVVVAGAAAGLRQTGLSRRVSLWAQGRLGDDDPEAAIERVFTRLELHLAEEHRDRNPGETVRAYLEAVDAGPRPRELAAVRERARYRGKATEEHAAEARALLAEIRYGADTDSGAVGEDSTTDDGTAMSED